MKKNPPQKVPEYSNFPKPAFRVMYDEFMKNSLYRHIYGQVGSLMEDVAFYAFLEGWTAAGGESPYVVRSAGLDRRTAEQLVPEEKYPPVEE